MNQNEAQKVRDAFEVLGHKVIAQRQQQSCPLPDRWFAVYLGQSEWTASEKGHLTSGCPLCEKTAQQYHQVFSPEPAQPVVSPSDPVEAANQVGLGQEAALQRLQDHLEPFLRQLRTYVRQHRAGYLRGKVDTYGIVNSAFNALALGLASQQFRPFRTTEDIKRLLMGIVIHKLHDEVRDQTRQKRAAKKVEPLGTPVLQTVADPHPPPTDLPADLYRRLTEPASEHGIAIEAPPPAVDPEQEMARTAAEIADWLGKWEEPLRKIHPRAMEIIDMSLRGRSNNDIGRALGVGPRQVQLIKQRLRKQLAQMLVTGEQ
jgi:DNA-directed RNA polymerase specialized sigma24 family protein